MRASTTFFTAAFAAVASAQSSQQSVDAFPQTSYLQQTNSLGVVTGMPAAATSQPGQPAVVTNQPGQPAVVTSQPLPANIPAVGSGITTLILPGTGSMFNQTRTVVVSANNSTTVEIKPTPSGSGAGASGSGASATGSGATGSRASGSPTSSSGSSASGNAAANVKVAAGSFVGFGAIVAAFL